jgi:hypothetical protein
MKGGRKGLSWRVTLRQDDRAAKSGTMTTDGADATLTQQAANKTLNLLFYPKGDNEDKTDENMNNLEENKACLIILQYLCHSSPAILFKLSIIRFKSVKHTVGAVSITHAPKNFALS